MTHGKPNRGLDKLEPGDLEDVARLKGQRGWTRLQAHYRDLAERQKQDWGEAVYKGEPPTRLEAAYRAGFWEGALAVLDTPVRAEDRLRRELERRGQRA